MKKTEADKILSEMESGYDLVSGKFSETRKYFWRGLEFIGDYSKDGDRIFDYGCGNGRLLELFAGKKIKYFGVDVSEKLIDLAIDKYGESIHSIENAECISKKSVNFSKIDPVQTSLPFQDNFFNAVYSIAVFHHFPGKEYRNEMAKELYRITKPGGYIVITVWNLWDKRYIKNILSNWISKFSGKSSLDWNDCCITFKDNKGNIFNRYHHAFTKREVIKLFSRAGFRKEMILRDRNIVYVGIKAA
jgi:ubiquinone/menaquinone biosynthesis C-methylase UbiE